MPDQTSKRGVLALKPHPVQSDALIPLSLQQLIPDDTDEFVITRSDFRIRLADCDGQRSQVSMLINRMYSWRGYLTDTASILTRNPNQLTLAASDGTDTFATITLGLDGQEGLMADQLYKKEVDDLRNYKRKLCELTKLAVSPNYNTKEVLGSLFHLAHIFGRRIHGATDVLIEVNPKHVDFYKHMLGFREVGPCRLCPRVGAPAVLLHLELAYVDKQIARLGGLLTKRTRSLYPFFFSMREEEGLLRRFTRLQ